MSERLDRLEALAASILQGLEQQRELQQELNFALQQVRSQRPEPTLVHGLKVVHYPPRRGEHYLSVNLAAVGDVVAVFELAKTLGFQPELVQVLSQTKNRIHVLLFYEQTTGEAFTNLDQKTDQLAEAIPPDAILHTWGGRPPDP